jgi:metal-responsive CopG/Arc/MetJ family transcriptional regulator
MSKSISAEKKRRGRPATGHHPAVATRLPESLVAAVDSWAKANACSRAEAIRRLVGHALKHNQPRRVGPHKGASKAVVMAGKELDRLADTSATEEERQSRKRRILKGPREFREMRADLPKRRR